MPDARLIRILARLAIPDGGQEARRLCAVCAEITDVDGAGIMLLADGRPQGSVCTSDDTSTRIEELRVRGETRKITVQPKNSAAPAYEIIVGDASHDLSAGANTSRDTVGKRVWRVLDF